MPEVYNPAMRIGIAQINSRVGAIRQNVEEILSRIAEAKQAACNLVIFPELALCGYTPFDLLWRSGFAEKVAGALQEIACASQGIGVIVGGLSSQPAREGENLTDPSSIIDGAGCKLFNTAFLIADGRLMGAEEKLHLPTFDVYHEKRYFTAGAGAKVFDFLGMRLGISICEDLWVEDGPADVQASLGAELLINISASPFFAGKAAIRRRLCSQRATASGVTLVCVNRVGGQDELVFDGGSFIVGPNGDLLCQAPHFEEGLFVADLGCVAPVSLPHENPIQLIHQAIVLGIRDYVRNNGFSRVIVGLSGGIDSAIVAVLASEALGPEAVTGVFLPSEITSEESRQDAVEAASRLSIELLEIPLAEVLSSAQCALPEAATGLAAENLQARIRGCVLMTLANQSDALVLATGNKSEISMGYNTLYGDTVGALAPIADLFKTDVYCLAEVLGDRIPQRVREKAPTAELRPGQRDEDDLPPYAVLDPILRKLIEQNSSREQLIAQGFPEAVVDDVLTRYYRSEYKRRQLPPGIKVSPKAFGIGRRMPITHGYRG